MASGINHAKQIVIDEATELTHSLQNGKSGCIETQGKALALLVKMITPLYLAEFVTIQKCEDMQKNGNGFKNTKIKIGPVEIQGQIATTMIINSVPVLCCGVLVFIIGKIQLWW